MHSEPNRLDRIEALLESNARSLQASNEAAAAKNAEIRALIESNAKSFQAFQEEMREITRDAAQERQELRQATLGLVNLLASLDEDRPTVFRRLNVIETKLDQLLQSRNETT